MGAEFLKSINLLCEEKGLSVEYILEALEQGLIKAYKKDSGGSENVKVDIDTKFIIVNVYYGEDKFPEEIQGISAADPYIHPARVPHAEEFEIQL